MRRISRILRIAFKAATLQYVYDWFDNLNPRTQVYLLGASLTISVAHYVALFLHYLIPVGFKQIPGDDWVDAWLDIGGSMFMMFFVLMLGPEKRKKAKAAKAAKA